MPKIDGRGLSGFMFNPAGLGVKSRCRITTFITCLYRIPQGNPKCKYFLPVFYEFTMSAMNSSGVSPALAMLCPWPDAVCAQSPGESVTSVPLSL